MAIKCKLCRSRIRPPSLPWTMTDSGVHFYQTTSNMMAYAKWLAELAKRIPLIHEQCAKEAEPGTLPQRHLIALNLDVRLPARQRRTA